MPGRRRLRALAVIVALGCLALEPVLGRHRERLRRIGHDSADVVRYFIPLAVLAVGLWASFRIVQMPAFADFLISVEGEMNKVSWPSRGELFRASLVVILVIFFLAALLFAYDVVLDIWLLDGCSTT